MTETPTPKRQPGSATSANTASKPAVTSKDERLAEALRANLRRRKAPRAAAGETADEQTASEKPEDRS